MISCFNESVKSNIGKIFLQILKECFPKNHILYKICNRNTIKISYRTMPNMKSYISKHNSKIIQQNLQPNLQPNPPQNLQLSNKDLEKTVIVRTKSTAQCQENVRIAMQCIGTESHKLTLVMLRHILAALWGSKLDTSSIWTRLRMIVMAPQLSALI